MDERMINELCRALHDGYRKWMIEGGWAGHRYLPETRTHHDKDGEFTEVVCSVRGCVLPQTQHDPWMLPFERLPDSRMRLYRTMIGNVVQTYARNGRSWR